MISTRKTYKKLWLYIILEWVVIPFHRGSSQRRDRIQVSCITGRFFTIWGTPTSAAGPVIGVQKAYIDWSDFIVIIYIYFWMS